MGRACERGREDWVKESGKGRKGERKTELEERRKSEKEEGKGGRMERKENIEKEGSREWEKIKDRILCEESKRRMAEMREKEIAGGKMQRHRKR